jgi:hypothetical protein
MSSLLLKAAGDSFMAYKMGKGQKSKLLQELKEKYSAFK